MICVLAYSASQFTTETIDLPSLHATNFPFHPPAIAIVRVDSPLRNRWPASPSSCGSQHHKDVTRQAAVGVDIEIAGRVINASCRCSRSHRQTMVLCIDAEVRLWNAGRGD